ncbi:MAG: hypothetical protein HC819_04955 [Cyclobacteriaceae bacterium]|nr:hypothetical protein [Cyclobacteriaceae bacterium]
MEGKLPAFLILVFYVIIASGSHTFAQREMLVLEKTFTNKKLEYGSGDEISFKLKNEDFFRTDHIVALNDTAIEFHYNQIAYHEIAAIDLKGRRFSGANLRAIGGKLQFVGLAYIAIDQFNQVVVAGDDASFNSNVWIVGGLIYAAGTIMKFSQPKK